MIVGGFEDQIRSDRGLTYNSTRLEGIAELRYKEKPGSAGQLGHVRMMAPPLIYSPSVDLDASS